MSDKYRMVCEPCDNEGTTKSEQTARDLVRLHNEADHDGEDVAEWAVVHG